MPKLKAGLKRNRTLIIAFCAMCVAIAALGMYFRSRDLDNTARIDNLTQSEPAMRYNTLDPGTQITELTDIMRENYMHFIKEYRSGKNVWHIIGQSGTYWITSGFMIKVTITAGRTKPPGESEKPIWQVLVYVMEIKSSAMLFVTIALICILGFGCLLINKERLPHLFPGQREDITHKGE
ncbi:MAG: hypothetical protein DRP46_05820 [Candidatus Zixiibacteriota bacterium]|nr:MAG: hypothetical protein DRP46_05820 [candidate division Zixibacteria bacterium]